MHPSAYTNAEKFANKYLANLKNEELKIVDIGSMDINGTLKPIFAQGKWKYTGADLGAGKNVDVVIIDPYKHPFADSTFDVVISSSCLEHDPAFWVTFQEMVRIIKPQGYIYICTPFNARVHKNPIDCWRFYPDAYLALSKWCPQAKLIETYIDDKDKKQIFFDNIGIFRVDK